MVQTKEQEKSLETDFNEMDISDLLDKGFKIIVIKMLTKVRRINAWTKLNFQQRERKYKTGDKQKTHS